MKTNISVEDAFELILENSAPLGQENLSLSSAMGRRFAVDITAQIPLPPFDNSAVDGYALGSKGKLGDVFEVVDTIGAGEVSSKVLKTSQSCRIMTGAKIPRGTQCVIMQEHVQRKDNIVVLEEVANKGDHIRFLGEDLRVGQIVAKRGNVITPAQIGLLSALGVAKVDVLKRPRVAIISTGDELIEPGEELPEGKVYYCTGPMMHALCDSAQSQVSSVVKAADKKETIIEAVKNALESDVVIMIGGMAAGLFDFGRYAFEQNGVEPLFFRGMWRPGKPLFFGRSGQKLVFGLPGNPVAAFVMFKVFVEPALKRLSGKNGDLKLKRSRIIGEWPKITPNAQFLRAKKEHNGLRLLPGQGSHQLFTLSLADNIVFIPPNCENYEERIFSYLPLES